MSNEIKPNYCCKESGYDFAEQETRQEFEEWAIRKGYKIDKDKEYNWCYASNATELVWSVWHVAHVRGREFILDKHNCGGIDWEGI